MAGFATQQSLDKHLADGRVRPFATPQSYRPEGRDLRRAVDHSSQWDTDGSAYVVGLAEATAILANRAHGLFSWGRDLR